MSTLFGFHGKNTNISRGLATNINVHHLHPFLQLWLRKLKYLSTMWTHMNVIGHWISLICYNICFLFLFLFVCLFLYQKYLLWKYTSLQYFFISCILLICLPLYLWKMFSQLKKPTKLFRIHVLLLEQSKVPRLWRIRNSS